MSLVCTHFFVPADIFSAPIFVWIGLPSIRHPYHLKLTIRLSVTVLDNIRVTTEREVVHQSLGIDRPPTHPYNSASRSSYGIAVPRQALIAPTLLFLRRIREDGTLMLVIISLTIFSPGSYSPFVAADVNLSELEWPMFPGMSAIYH